MIIQTETNPQKAARILAEAINKAAESRVAHWKHAFNLLWNSELASPQEILDVLGNQAATIFAINTGETTDLITQLTAYGQNELLSQVVSLVSTVPDHTINEDGTVTITIVEEPEPEVEP